MMRNETPVPSAPEGGHQRRYRRLGSAARLTAVLTVVAMMGILLAPGSEAEADAADVGSLRPSTVQVLDGGTLGEPVTLDEARKAVQAYLEDDWSNGKGIDVALIDTGVAPVAGLDGENVVHGPDLSFEAEKPEIAFLDTFGHGTHMAGIIAGRRDGHQGIAPGARIVSVKTAGYDGVTTVPQVIAAIDWVVDHHDAEGMNIQVLNLSLGQAGITTHVGDLLSAAVERAWQAGIFVVVAAGNSGDSQKHLDSPAIDPYVLAVGGYDMREENVPEWSARGDEIRNPDAIAVGRSLVSYRVPGSTLDRDYPSARYGKDMFLGSGTSQAAAITSGMAAVLLSARPDLSPDELKAVFTNTADDLEAPPTRDGHGVVNGHEAYESLGKWSERQKHETAAGPGTGIEAPTGATWKGGTWSGATWSGATWSGATWSGGTWSGATWSGATWSGATWSGATWSGATWSGGTWSGATWSGATWSGATWSGDGWV